MLQHRGDLETTAPFLIVPMNRCVSPDFFPPATECWKPKGQEYTGKVGTASLSKKLCVVI